MSRWTQLFGMTREEEIRHYRSEGRLNMAIAIALEDGTYDAIMVQPETWVAVLPVAEALGITPQAANNRLKRLFELRICDRRRRQGEGKVYEYRWIPVVVS